jgi:hypothetical protein
MSCGRSSPTDVEYGPIVEYGVPYATYRLSGQIVKSADQTPLEGIEVSFDEATVATDSGGD